MTIHTVIDSPLGPLTLVADGDALCGVYLHQQRHRPVESTFGKSVPTAFGQVEAELTEYFAGERGTFDTSVVLHGTPFQCAVWQALRQIPYGATRTYGELATAVGRPTAARAVGLANGKNPVSVIVPCHRLVGAHGALTDYGGGLERKRYLLDLEAAGAHGAGG